MKISYESIIGLSRPRSRHFPMPMAKRAAQFAPFAALSGYEESVAETVRFTETAPLPDEQELSVIDRKIAEAAERGIPAKLTLFVPDSRKKGGAYRTETVHILKIDEFSRELVLEGKRRLPADQVVRVELLL